MNKQEHINYWLLSAEKDLEVMKYLEKGGKYVYTLFFAHLFLEKICKALWVKNNNTFYPPKTHNLLKLLKESNINISDDMQLFLIKLNKYQIEGRYPEDINDLYKVTNKRMASTYIQKVKEFHKWLQKELQ